MIGTFYNPGWLHAHVKPLADVTHLSKIYVVCDEIVDEEISTYAEFVCPSERRRKWLGRGLARLTTLIGLAWKRKPDIYMGYHIMPNAPLALLMARVFGGKAVYQMTGGPIQIQDGGIGSENRLLKATRFASAKREQRLFDMVRCFDAVIVRGTTARNYVERHQLAKQCICITGAINTERFQPSEADTCYDVIFVGRLVPYKGLDLLLDIISQTAEKLPQVRFAIVGAGELREWMGEAIIDQGLEGNVRFLEQQIDVVPYLQRSKVFVLTSPSEGMSIAMLEALACGLPAIVRNVGDLADALQTDNGVLIDEHDASPFCEAIVRILSNPQTLHDMSQHARTSIVEGYSVQQIAKRWDHLLHEWQAT